MSILISFSLGTIIGIVFIVVLAYIIDKDDNDPRPSV